MTNLLALAQKQLQFASDSFQSELKDIKSEELKWQSHPSERSQIADQFLQNLGAQNSRATKLSSIKGSADTPQQKIRVADLKELITRVNTLKEITRVWMLYELSWQQKRRLSRQRATPTERQIFRRRAIVTGEKMVRTIYARVADPELKLKWPVDSIIVVPFMNDLRTGGFEMPLPYITTPRWGYTQPWTWPAYAHEVGHHIYRNVEGLRDELKVNLVHYLLTEGYSYEMVSLWYNWLEEMFADLFAVLQIGPVFAQTQQYHMLLALPFSSLGNLHKEDDARTILLNGYDFTHPNSYVRACLSHHALSLINPPGLDILNRLEKRWTEFFDGLDTTHLTLTVFTISKDGPTPNREIKEKTEDIKNIGFKILQFLLGTDLYSLADSKGTPRKIRDVFAAPQKEDDLLTEVSNAANVFETEDDEDKLIKVCNSIILPKSKDV